MLRFYSKCVTDMFNDRKAGEELLGRALKIEK